MAVRTQFTSSGARVVQKDIANIGGAAVRTGANVNVLTNSLKGLGAAVVIRGIIRTADSFTLIQNRLKVVTGSTEELVAVTEELLGVSSRTRTSFEANAELFQRFAAATERIGLAQGELLRIVESINQAVTISGVTSVEAAQALRQLAQGIGSSELRGQELRSVLEQLPKVADVIAARFGVTRGELLKLGEQGKIGAVQVLEAFQDARPELAKAFAEIVPTVGQALIVLKNEFIAFIGELNKSTGVVTALSRGILFVARNFEVFGRILLAVAIVLGTEFAIKAVGRAIKAIKALNVALLSNPFTAIAVVITTLIALIVSFADRIKVAEGSMATIADVAVVAWERIKGAIAIVVKFFNENFGFIADFARKVFGDIEFSVEGMAKFVARVIDTQVGLWRGLSNVIALFAGKIFDLFREPLNALIKAFKQVINSIIAGFSFLVEGIRTVMNSLIDAANRLALVAIPRINAALKETTGFDAAEIAKIGIGALQGIGAEAGQAFLEGFNQGAGAEAAVDRFFDDVRARAAERAKLEGEQADLERGVLEPGAIGRTVGQQRFLDEALQAIIDQRDALVLLNFERSIQNDLLKIEESLKKKNVALDDAERENLRTILEGNALLEEQSKILQELVGETEDLHRQLGILDSLYAAGKITIDQYNEAVRETTRALAEQEQTITAGFDRAFLDLTDSAVNFADITSDLLTSAFGAAEDAFVEFVKTGEFQFDKLVESILEDLARLAFRQAIFGLLTAGGAGGGFGAPGIPTGGQFLFGRQAGGPVSAGEPVIVGERRAEVFVPTQSGNIIPQVAQEMPEVNLNVVNVTDPEEIAAEISSTRGEQAIINVVRRNRNSIRNVLGF